MLKLKNSKKYIITADFDFIKNNHNQYEKIYEEKFETISSFSLIHCLKDSLEQSFILTSLSVICSLACIWFFSAYLYYSIGYSIGLLDVY